MPVVQFDWDDIEDNIDEEFDEHGNSIVEYTTEPGYHGNVESQFRDGVTSTFHHDGLGTTIAVTNDAGDVTDTLAYNAFGSVTHRTGTTEFPFQFVGQKGYYFDEKTGDYYIRRRPYRPAVARWLSIDPFPYQADNYVYVKNRVLIYFDPSGLAPPFGAFAKIPVCLCTIKQLLAMKGVKTNEDPDAVVKQYHPGASRCFRVWIAGATAGNQCCFDKDEDLITWGAGAGTPDIYNPEHLTDHYFDDFLPFERFEEKCGRGLGWSAYHQAGWQPISATSCKENPPKPRPAQPSDAAEILAAIKSTAARNCTNICTQEMLENFDAPSPEADAFYASCYLACYAKELARLMALARSGPIEIQPK